MQHDSVWNTIQTLFQNTIKKTLFKRLLNTIQKVNDYAVKDYSKSKRLFNTIKKVKHFSTLFKKWNTVQKVKRYSTLSKKRNTIQR